MTAPTAAPSASRGRRALLALACAAFLLASAAAPPPEAAAQGGQIRLTPTELDFRMSGGPVSRSGIARLRLANRGKAALTGRATLRTQKAVRTSPRARARKLTLATISFDVAAGRTKLLRVRISRAGRAALRRAGRLRVHVRLRVIEPATGERVLRERLVTLRR